MTIDDTQRGATIQALITDHSESQKTRIERGVNQVADFWRDSDGDSRAFDVFCRDHFIADPSELERAFERLDLQFESIDGHMNKLYQDLRRPLDLDWGPITKLDQMLAQFDPSAHLTDDFFDTKIAFVILLNFRYYTLEEKQTDGSEWTSRQWAEARLGDMFISRVPADVQQNLTAVNAQAGSYISQYNIYMGQLVDNDGNRQFPSDLKLISHWGLREELKAQYSAENGLEAQKIIYRVMERIIAQEIPEQVIDNNKYTWNPFDNEVKHGQEIVEADPEPNRRYQHLLDVFRAMQRVDEYYPNHATWLARKFRLQREMSAADVESLFEEYLKSEQLKKTAAVVKKRLGRDLMPFDIWYDGFKARSDTPEEKLNEVVAERFPNLKAFEAGIRDTLLKLDFTPEQAEFIAPRIVVDPARGAGHAWRAQMKSEKAHLRTRVPEGGMDYKGFNIAMHELGHNVEQTLTLHKVDHHFVEGVPTTAFTEAFAFLFQNRDLEVLGLAERTEDVKAMQLLDRFWYLLQMIGVSLTDIRVWRWLYDNPDTDAVGLKTAVTDIATDCWNEYFAPLIGVKDQTILAIYSHMISYPLYLADYPIGQIINLQIEQAVEGKPLGPEMERMCSVGKIAPQIWMKNAVGSEISLKSVLSAVDKALESVS